MSKQPKFTRNDRFAQMSQQERLIEQKKREILAKMEAKNKANKTDTAKTKQEATVKQPGKSPTSATGQKEVNTFANDGSFLDQFKQLKESKKTEKLKPFGRLKEHEKSNSDDKHKSSNRWAPRRRSPSPKDRSQKRGSRFSADKLQNFEQKITINTSFSSAITNQQFENPVNVIPQNVTGQPLLKNVVPPPVPGVPYSSMQPQQPVLQTSIAQQNLVQSEAVITAPQVLLNVPPPQLMQGQISSALVLNQAPSGQNVLVSTPLQSVLTTVNIPPPLVANNVTPVPPPCLATVELASIPPPNPIQVQNIPQPEPLNTLNIPQPAPIQVQNIPTPGSIQLNEIPNPKPIDLMAIPTPNEKSSISNPDFIKNIPPPNKSIPPPNQLHENQIPIITVASTPNVLVPPTIQGIHSSQIVTLPVGVVQVTTVPPPTITVSCPVAGVGHNSFLSQPPPQLPPVNIPPPNRLQAPPLMGEIAGFKDLNIVFPPGTQEYESMASLGRMVAQCGQGIEDMVKKRETQDPNLWFLFHPESAAYRQYRALIEQFRRENQDEKKDGIKKEAEPYEPEMALEEEHDEQKRENTETIKDEKDEQSREERRRKRKSRWGEKADIPPPVVICNQPVVAGVPTVLPASAMPVANAPLLTKLTRNDPGLVQYAVSTYGSANLTEEEWKKAEESYKVHLVYQEMVRKQEEAKRLKLQGKNKYEYDSDEEIDGGTWEHKAREKEMMKTQVWADELTRQAEGKHHIGDFLPPDELKKFLDKKQGLAGDASTAQYDACKLKEDNVGFRMLQKLGWSEGEGLGSGGKGILDPIKAEPREHTQGLGLDKNEDEDEYESYRKRMMLAYRFRPNPLNNPRRPYY